MIQTAKDHKIIEVTGVSHRSREGAWEDAAREVIAQAGNYLNHSRIADVTAQDTKIDGKENITYRTVLRLSFESPGD